MAEWNVGFPVAFTANGDRTNVAVEKHIFEFERLYGLLGTLRRNFSGAGFPADAVKNELYIKPSTFEAFVFAGISGAGDWRPLVCTPARHSLDKHNAGSAQDLQDLVSDAVVVFLTAAPSSADNGKVLAVDNTGKVVLSSAIDVLLDRIADLEERVSVLERKVSSQPVLESVAELPALPDGDTWYFVREASAL